MGTRYAEKDFHVIARQIWLTDQLKCLALDRRDWSAATLHEKLACEKRARDFLARQNHA